MKRLMRNEKGLTLIELLAVIVILGVIAAIAVPSIGGIIDKTKDDAKKAEAIMIFEAARLYMATNQFTPSETDQDTMTIPFKELLPYLEKLSQETKDVVDDINITVTKVTEDGVGKYTYSISGHPYNNISNKTTITEDELLITDK